MDVCASVVPDALEVWRADSSAAFFILSVSLSLPRKLFWNCLGTYYGIDVLDMASVASMAFSRCRRFCWNIIRFVYGCLLPMAGEETSFAFMA